MWGWRGGWFVSGGFEAGRGGGIVPKGGGERGVRRALLAVDGETVCVSVTLVIGANKW